MHSGGRAEVKFFFLLTTVNWSSQKNKQTKKQVANNNENTQLR